VKFSRKLIMIGIAAAAAAAAIILFNISSGLNIVFRYALIVGIVFLALVLEYGVMHSGSAAVVSDAKRLKTVDDYIKAFEAWEYEDTPFVDQIKVAEKQLGSLKRKQAALRSILDDSKDSPFLTTAADVEQYILANSKRILNRVMIFDQGEPYKYNTHAQYLQGVLNENAKVLSDFENLILEVSQIGDDANAATPCLNELTAALRSVREPEEQWNQLMSGEQ